MEHLQPLITIIATISAGVFCVIIADRLKLPSILFLLVTGVCLGPYGLELIQPSVFKDELPQYITLLVALILFEGGTNLRFEQLRDISRPLRSLLSIAPAITLACATMGAHWILNMSWVKSILFGSILIVTGPTVVQPILHRLRVKEKIHNLLKWESILIDPLGVIAAIVLSEVLLIDNIGPLEGFGLLGARIFIGLVLGILAAEVLFFFLSRPLLLRFETEELCGVFVLAINVLFYGISEAVLSHSGIVAVTAAGIVFGNKRLANMENILRFKKQLTLIALSTIFILLSANIPLPRISDSILKEGTLFLIFLIFIVRPVSVLLSTMKEPSLALSERLFICFFAPRGIVSAVLASLFTILFEKKELIGRGVFLPLAFYIIIGSIIFYSVASWFIARLLKVLETERKSIIIVGVNAMSLLIAGAAKRHHFPAVFIDTNPELCRKARAEGFDAYCGNGADRNFLESIDLKGAHQMLAATPNHEANVLSCQLMSSYLGKHSVFRLWDKTDTWEKVTSAVYNETWGRPIILTALKTYDAVSERKLTAGEKTLTSSLELNRDACLAQNGNDIPLFAITRGAFVFAVPELTLPSSSIVAYLKDT